MDILKKLLATISDDEELSARSARLLSLFFLAVAGSLSLVEYTREVTGSPWRSWAVKVASNAVTPMTTTYVGSIRQWIWPEVDSAASPDSMRIEKFRFRPGFKEGVLAIALVTPLYVRGLLKWNASIYSILSFILILLVIAAFVTLALGGSSPNDIAVPAALTSAVALSWLGMRSVAGASWLIALGTAVYAVQSNSFRLDIYGFAFIAAASLGLILHSGLNPGQFFHGVAIEYSPAARQAAEASRRDVQALRDSVGNAAKAVLDRTLS